MILQNNKEGCEMYKAIEIAKYVINYSQKTDSPISNLKLQKLLFYIQAAILVKTGKECFKEPIMAWEYGPVVREVYDEFKIYGREDIPLQASSRNLGFDYSKIQIVYQNEEMSLRTEEMNLINKVVDAYAKVKNPFELVKKTHSEDPWKNTKRGCEISVDSIKAYYSIHEEKIYNS